MKWKWMANPYYAQLGFSPHQARYWDVEKAMVLNLWDDIGRVGGLEDPSHWKLVWRPLQVGREGRYVLVTAQAGIAYPMAYPKGYRGAIVQIAADEDTRLRPTARDETGRVLEYRGIQ